MSNKVRKFEIIIKKRKMERERERERDDTYYNCKPNHWRKQNCCDCKTKECIATATSTTKNSRLQYFSLYNFFIGKMKLVIIFM